MKKAISIILIPVFLVVILLIVDTVNSYTANKKIQKDTEEIIKMVMEDETLTYKEYDEKIRFFFEKRGYDNENLVVKSSSYSLYVENSYYYFGLFNSIFNKVGKTQPVEIFGVTFNIKKNSMAFIKVTARKDSKTNEIEFKYEK